MTINPVINGLGVQRRSAVMRRGAALLAPAMLSVPMPAQAEDWVYVATNPNGAVVYIDADSIRANGPSVTAREKWDHSKDKTVAYRTSTSLWRYNCATKIYSVLSYTDYAPDGSVMARGSDSSDSPETRIAQPGSIDWDIMQYVCGNAGSGPQMKMAGP